MNRLPSEWQRLFGPPALAGQEQAPDDAPLIDARGQVRAMVLALARPADWAALSPVWHGVQADLDLPAPAIAVAGADGYQLWFSLAEPVAVAQAAAFLDALRRRYLGDVKASRVGLLPAVPAVAAVAAVAAASSPLQAVHARRVPAALPDNGHWSAFVTADLAPVFADEPWLDSPPNPAGQAELLSRLRSIPITDFQLALQRLQAAAPRIDAIPAVDSSAAVEAGSGSGVGSGLGSDECIGPAIDRPAPTAAGRDPKRFLLDVMNDDSVPLGLRIDAAKALLPYVDELGPA